MENFVRERFHVVRCSWNSIDTAFIKPGDDHDCAVRNTCWPFTFYLYYLADYILGFNNQFRVTERTFKKAEQPVLPFFCFCKVELVKYREFLFAMKNRQIVICSVIYFHSNQITCPFEFQPFTFNRFIPYTFFKNKITVYKCMSKGCRESNSFQRAPAAFIKNIIF